MGIGGSILLMVVGAILAFGLNNQSLGPLNLEVIGWILMLAGLFGLVLTLYVWNSRRSRTTRVVQAPPQAYDIVPPPPGNPPVTEERYTERRQY